MMNDSPVLILSRVLEHIGAALPSLTAGYDGTTAHPSHAEELARAAVELSAAAADLAGLARRVTADITAPAGSGVTR